MAIERLSQAESIPVTQDGVILVYTGTFAPVHLGHADAMSAAATELRIRGEAIDLAMFVPKHDKSLQTKLGTDASEWSFDNRVNFFIGHESPLGHDIPTYVDDITGRDTYNDTIGKEALNTVSKLGMAASRAVLVVGSDRGDTAKSLLETNRVICVRRPQYMTTIDSDARNHPWLQSAIEEGRYIITEPRDPSIIVSSTAIRAGTENGWVR